MAPGRTDFHQAINVLHAEAALTAAHHFEQLVLALFDAVAAAHGMPVTERRGGPRRRFDAFLPAGLPRLEEPTGVTVVFLRSTEQRDRERLGSRLRGVLELAAAVGVTQVLAAHNQSFPGLREEVISQSGRDVDLILWGAPELEELAESEPEAAAKASSQFVIESVERSIRSAGEWRDESAALFADLAETYNSEGVTLFIGAGVSQGSGLPGWEALIGGLFAVGFGPRLKTSLTAPETLALSQAAADLNSHSPIQTARYLRDAIALSGTDFAEELACVLYSDKEPTSNPLLESIASLCVPNQDGSRVQSVITYNFDDLLETVLGRLSVRSISIFREHDYATSSELPIYHVHGFLPRNRRDFEHLDQSLLAFSEEAYHQLYSDPYHWSNIVQLMALRQQPCVFVGLSLTDPNLRRVLDIASRGLMATSPRHFAILRRVSDDALTSKHPSLRDIPTRARREFLDIHHSVEESVLKTLGVSAIWFETFDEIATSLRSLRAPQHGT